MMQLPSFQFVANTKFNEMKSIKKVLLYVIVITGCIVLTNCASTSRISHKNLIQMDNKVIVAVMAKTVNWQIDSIKKNGWRFTADDWVNGALYTGLVNYAKATNEDSVFEFLRTEVGEKLNYKITTDSNRYHADWYCVGQLYISLYERYKEPKMLDDLKLLADTLLDRPHSESLLWENKIAKREWAWCDALFMAPPTLAMLSKITGNKDYLDLTDKLWWKTTDYLYDKKEFLFYRDSRFFDRNEANGEKVFWSRGNGWVIAGLVRVMDYMPKEYPNRARYEVLFKEMAAKIAKLQQPDGTWRTSLLDPLSYPSKETSGTAFFCYALAWGVNNGLLDKSTYLPIIEKSWRALVSSVQPNGMLGYVQPIGNKAKAEIKATDTQLYGVGGFLLAGTEILKME